jgi:hypothetical protein
VSSGYRIVEEYLRQGQDAARTWGSFGGGGPSAGGGGNEMMRVASQLATMWLDFMGMMVPGGSGTRAPTTGTAAPTPSSGEPTPPAAPAPHPPASAPQAAATAVSIEIASVRRTEVMIELRPRSSDLSLRVQALRAPDPDLPRITGVTIESIPSEDRVAVRLAVPDDQPPGIYSGVILDATTSLPRGTLSLRIADA